MKKTIFFLFSTACILNACHSDTNSVNNTKTLTTIATDTAKSNAIVPQPADTSIKDGLLIKKYPNGVVKEKSYYVAGRRQGECQSFYPNGKLQSDDYFAAGLMDGATVTYFDNGQKRYEGAFIKGKPSGKWIFYDNNTGKQVSVKNYDSPKKNPAI